MPLMPVRVMAAPQSALFMQPPRKQITVTMHLLEILRRLQAANWQAFGLQGRQIELSRGADMIHSTVRDQWVDFGQFNGPASQFAPIARD